MGEERCKCCDFGWDQVSRSIHYECGICKKHHMPSRFPYDTDLNKILPVVAKLRERGHTVLIDNVTEWSVTLGDLTTTQPTLIKALHCSIVHFLIQKRDKKC
jgi:hypothetical protein